jgi:hypothetical protein
MSRCIPPRCRSVLEKKRPAEGTPDPVPRKLIVAVVAMLQEIRVTGALARKKCSLENSMPVPLKKSLFFFDRSFVIYYCLQPFPNSE